MGSRFSILHRSRATTPARNFLAVFLCAALLASQAFGWWHRVAHAQIWSATQQGSAESPASGHQASDSASHSAFHSCIALDAAALAHAAQSPEYRLPEPVLAGLPAPAELPAGRAAETPQYFLSRAPPLS